MAWIESHQELREHPKTKRLCRLLAINRREAVGLLHFLWWWAYDYASDGDLSGFEDDDIADGVDWEGDAGELVRALICAGFIDDDRRLHDWEDFALRWIERRRANAERMRARRSSLEGNDDEKTRAAHVQRTTTARAYATGPNRTKPNRTKPEQQQAAAALAVADAPDDAAASAAAANGPDGSAVPAALAGFHEVLSGVQGYQPSAAFLRQVAERYGALDLTEEALKMASWLADPARNRGKRSATTRFVLNWLKKSLEEGAPQERNAPLEADDGEACGESLAPPSDADAALWAGALSDLAEAMSRPNWETYIAPLSLAGRAADGGLRLRAPPGLGDALRRFRGVIVRSLDDAGDPGATRVAIVEARPGQE